MSGRKHARPARQGQVTSRDGMSVLQAKSSTVSRCDASEEPLLQRSNTVQSPSARAAAAMTESVILTQLQGLCP